MEQLATINRKDSSLLTQIVDEKDKLSEVEKAKLPRKQKLQQVVEKLKLFEKSLTPTSMTEA